MKKADKGVTCLKNENYTQVISPQGGKQGGWGKRFDNGGRHPPHTPDEIHLLPSVVVNRQANAGR